MDHVIHISLLNINSLHYLLSLTLRSIRHLTLRCPIPLPRMSQHSQISSLGKAINYRLSHLLLLFLVINNRFIISKRYSPSFLLPSFTSNFLKCDNHVIIPIPFVLLAVAFQQLASHYPSFSTISVPLFLGLPISLTRLPSSVVLYLFSISTIPLSHSSLRPCSPRIPAPCPGFAI